MAKKKTPTNLIPTKPKTLLPKISKEHTEFGLGIAIIM